MKKLAGAIVVLIVVLASGCLGSNAQPSQETQTLSSNSSAVAQTSSVSSSSSPAVSERITLDKALRGIESYTYSRDVRMTTNLTITFSDNFTRRVNFSTIVRELGYVDVKERKAKINITTTTFPDNRTLNIEEVIIGNTSYLILNSHVKRMNSTDFWNVHPLAILLAVSKIKPLAQYTENGTLVLVYSPPEEVLRPLVKSYFGIENANTTITDAVIEVYISNKNVTEMRLVYSTRIEAVSEGISGRIRITGTGTWKSTVRFISINEKENIRPPT
ncbi:hypothetical protein [Thermococcus sp.]